MPANQNIAPIQNSGSANVPLGESTAGVYQAAPWTENVTTSGYQSIAAEVNVIEQVGFIVGLGQSGSNPGGPSLLGTTPPVILPALGISGNVAAGGVSVSGIIPVGFIVEGVVANSGIGGSGFAGNQAATVYGSGFASSPVSTASGVFGPAGYFTIQVLGLSGNPYVKVPFFNS